MRILYTFYGDDFTGSTDVLEQLASNGIASVLFLGLPTPEQLAAFPNVRAIGVAGDSRSRTPKWMSAHLPAIFTALQQFDAPVTHYKVCSTFDSSPSCGSIGRAIEIGAQVFGANFIPIVVGAPHLRRFVAFGNLFAAAPSGAIQRIDRHPMSQHPVTPMREPDLRLHLAQQTALPIGLIDVDTLRSGSVASALDDLLRSGCQAILFDTVDPQTQAIVGKLIVERAQQQQLFSASSSGLTAALISAWNDAKLLNAPPSQPPVAASHPLLVVSGSCSAATERQIRYALVHGYRGIAVDATGLLNEGTSAATFTEVLNLATQSLSAGQDTVLYTALGVPASSAHGERLGIALGKLLAQILAGTKINRVLLCGGDTASHAVQQLGLYALTWIASLQPGAPLCRAHADSALHHLELVLKGGQVGTDDFFDLVQGRS